MSGREMTMKRTMWALTLLLSLLGAAASAQTPIWRQPWDNRSTVMWSAKTTDGSIDQEIADDFDLTGRIDMIHVDGGYITYFNSPPMNLQSVVVRFYAWQGGTPGALQYERVVPASAVAVTSDTSGNFAMNIPLPAAFTASGKHFLSVQAIADMGWSWDSANTIQPKGAVMMTRKAGEGWSAANQSDAAMTLFGAITGPPRLDAVSDSALPRSGRLRLFGTDFGEVRGNGQVLIGGQSAIVTRWTGTTIHAYVPESAALGPNAVQVVTDNGGSAPRGVDVTTRTSPGGRATWRFQADAPSIMQNLVVGPDGTVYVLDVYAHLYALTPEGGLKWMTVAGGQGSRLTQGADGTLYAMADGRLTAVRPNGTIKWTFTHPNMNWTLSGPTVGPDGNIYGVVQYGLGFFSVTPEGQLRWSNSKVGDRVPRGNAIVFSHGQAYINHTHLDHPGLELMAFDMASGQMRWIRDADRDFQPLIGPNGRIYVDNLMGTWSSLIYNPDGSRFLYHEGSIGPRNFSPDLTKLYTRAFQSTNFAALNSLDLSTIWTLNTNLTVGAPTPDPFDRILLGNSHTPGSTSALVAATTAGEPLWKEVLPLENGGTIALTAGPAYAADGQTAYSGTTILGQNRTNEYAYVYAFALDTESRARVLWTEAGGRAMVMRGDQGSTAAYSPVFGPYEGWTAKLISAGPDNRPRLLWENVSGRLSLWSMDRDAQGPQTVADFGPYEGWRVQDMEVGSDNKPRVMWKHSSGKASLWTMNAAGTAFESVRDFGPYQGWSPYALSVGTDGRMRVLWRHTSGRVSMWKLNDDGSFATIRDYGPYTDWQMVDLKVGTDGKERTIWRHTGGKISIWTVEPDGSFSYQDYGSYSPWEYQSLSVDRDGKMRVLWSYEPGSLASLWRINAPYNFTYQDYGNTGGFNWKPRSLSVSAP